MSEAGQAPTRAHVIETDAGRFTVALAAHAPDAKALKAVIADYLERWPAQGYGTTFGTPHRGPEGADEEGGAFHPFRAGTWTAYGHRARSAGG